MRSPGRSAAQADIALRPGRPQCEPPVPPPGQPAGRDKRASRSRRRSSRSQCLPHAGRGRRAKAPEQQHGPGRSTVGLRRVKSHANTASSLGSVAAAPSTTLCWLRTRKNPSTAGRQSNTEARTSLCQLGRIRFVPVFLYWYVSYIFIVLHVSYVLYVSASIGM